MQTVAHDKFPTAKFRVQCLLYIYLFLTIFYAKTLLALADSYFSRVFHVYIYPSIHPSIHTICVCFFVHSLCPLLLAAVSFCLLFHEKERDFSSQIIRHIFSFLTCTLSFSPWYFLLFHSKTLLHFLFMLTSSHKDIMWINSSLRHIQTLGKNICRVYSGTWSAQENLKSPFSFTILFPRRWILFCIAFSFETEARLINTRLTHSTKILVFFFLLLFVIPVLNIIQAFSLNSSLKTFSSGLHIIIIINVTF